MTRRHRIDLRVLLGNTAVPLPASVTPPRLHVAAPPPPRIDRSGRRPNSRTRALLDALPREFGAQEWMAASGSTYNTAHNLLTRLVRKGYLTVKPYRRPGSGGDGGVVYVKVSLPAAKG